MDFESRGIRLTDIFDDSPQVIGQQIRGLTVRPISELETACQEHPPQVAILCIPKEAAPSIVERLLAVGVPGLLEFQPLRYSVRAPGSHRGKRASG